MQINILRKFLQIIGNKLLLTICDNSIKQDAGSPHFVERSITYKDINIGPLETILFQVVFYGLFF